MFKCHYEHKYVKCTLLAQNHIVLRQCTNKCIISINKSASTQTLLCILDLYDEDFYHLLKVNFENFDLRKEQYHLKQNFCKSLKWLLAVTKKIVLPDEDFLFSVGENLLPW